MAGSLEVCHSCFTKEKRTAEYSPSAMDDVVTFLSPTLDDDAKVRKDYELSKS